MAALVACCLGYGREAMLPHLDKVRPRGLSPPSGQDGAVHLIRGQSVVSSLPSV